MTNSNKYLSSLKSPIKFKPSKSSQEEKRQILKLCKRKLKGLRSTDFISVRTVLIKNTLKVIEKQELLEGFNFVEVEDDREDSPCYIESLLNEIDLDQSKLSNTLPGPVHESKDAEEPLSSKKPSDILEEFHICETLSQNSLITREDTDTVQFI